MLFEHNARTINFHGLMNTKLKFECNHDKYKFSHWLAKRQNLINIIILQNRKQIAEYLSKPHQAYLIVVNP